MKNLIIASTILDIVEIVLLVICFGYYIKQYFFGDYINELYKKFGLEMGEKILMEIISQMDLKSYLIITRILQDWII